MIPSFFVFFNGDKVVARIPAKDTLSYHQILRYAKQSKVPEWTSYANHIPVMGYDFCGYGKVKDNPEAWVKLDWRGMVIT